MIKKTDKNKNYILDLGYATTPHPSGLGVDEDLDKKLRKALGDSLGSGSGFGMRDHQFLFKSHELANKGKSTAITILKTKNFKIVDAGDLDDEKIKSTDAYVFVRRADPEELV